MNNITASILHPPRTSPHLPIFAGFLFVVLALFVLAWVKYDVEMALLLVFAILFMLVAGWRYETAVILSMAAVFLLQYYATSEEQSLMLYGYSPKMYPALFAVMLLTFHFNRSLASVSNALYPKLKSPSSVIITMFLAWGFFTLLRGFALHGDDIYIWYEANALLYFASFYFWIMLYRWDGRIFFWLAVLFVLGALTMFEYTFLVFYVFENIFQFLVERPITRQIQVVLLTIPFAFSYFILSKNVFVRIALGLVVLLSLFVTLASQQRTTWLVLAGMTFLYATLYFFQGGIRFKRVLLWFLLVVGFVILFGGSLYIASLQFEIDLPTLLKRWDRVADLRDESMRMRIEDIRDAIHLTADKWWWGHGAGRMKLFYSSFHIYFYFDNSYMISYFKGGIPFAVLLALVYASGAFRALQVYIRAKDPRARLLSLAIFTTLVGVSVSGLTFVNMMYYRFVIVWMALIAAATFLHQVYVHDEAKKQ